MKNLIILRNQLINHWAPETFVGNLVRQMLYQGLSSFEMEELVSTVLACAILNRVCGNNLKKIQELCPRLLCLVDEEPDHNGFRFEAFYKMILDY